MHTSRRATGSPFFAERKLILHMQKTIRLSLSLYLYIKPYVIKSIYIQAYLQLRHWVSILCGSKIDLKHSLRPLRRCSRVIDYFFPFFSLFLIKDVCISISIYTYLELCHWISVFRKAQIDLTCVIQRTCIPLSLSLYIYIYIYIYIHIFKYIPPVAPLDLRFPPSAN